MQTSLLILFLTLAILIAAVFLVVFNSSLKKTIGQEGVANPLQKRIWFILTLFVVLAILAAVTIPKSPYYQFATETPSRVVYVGAMQFVFLFSDNAITTDNPKGEPTLELPLNELIEFRVTSLDVNHGMGVYDPSNKLVAQVQAMPGYVNRLRWKFDKPGTYHILCLEFCGLIHQNMRASFTVK